ncbi:hypothetical protein [Streptomyces sp. NPDC020607]|uniref:hypothetical protein n=1 Tax=Streptomyces sp. NPDC020607 TaxID=3365082 RepID=UPI003789BD75
MPLRTTPAKAVSQIERRDGQRAAQYRAELRYFHYKPRYIIGVTNAYETVDEAYTVTDQALREAFGRTFARGAKDADWAAAYVREHYPPDSP